MLAPLVLQQRDLVVLRDLFSYRFAATPALFLSAEWATAGRGMQHFAKRLTLLWRAGYVERFHAGYSRYLHGSRHFLYTIGSGKASAAARTGLHPAEIPAARWRQVLAEARPSRERVRATLTAIGIERAEIERALHNCTELALKYYAGETSGVRHHVLAAEFLSRFWFEARMRGEAVEDIQPDGVADLSFREPEPRRFRELVTANGIVPIKPDCLFTIAGRRYALEAETGSSGASSICRKIRRYLRRLESVDPRLHAAFYCANAAHILLITRIIESVVPKSLRSAFSATSSHRSAVDRDLGMQ